MALLKFTKAILEGQPIYVYNHGDMQRDFTYVTDLVEAVRLLLEAVPERPAEGAVAEGDSLSPVAPHRVVNIGNSEPMQPGDVPATWADAALLQWLTGCRPRTGVAEAAG